MTLRKFGASQIFDGYRMLTRSVLVMDANGQVVEVISSEDAGDNVEYHDGILAPGFINCHCHLELSHMKGRIPAGTGLVDFVVSVVNERHHPDEEILEAIQAANDEMWSNGIAAVGDICNNTLTLPTKLNSRIWYHNFIEASGWLPAVSNARFERALNIYREYTARLPQGKSTVVPHAPYSVSGELWDLLGPGFENRTTTIHSQETKFEDEFFREGKGDFLRMFDLMKIRNDHHLPTGKTSLQSFIDRFQNAANLILVHNTFITPEDIEFLRQWSNKPGEEGKPARPGVFFCLCPNANLYIESALPPVELFIKNNCAMVLGTDSLASNHKLNILSEIEVIRKKYPSVTLEETLQWATINGARALQMAEQLGSFEKGKRPGVILLKDPLQAERLI